MKREEVIFNEANLALLWLTANPKSYLKRANGDIIRNYDGNSMLEIEKWYDFNRIGSVHLETEKISHEEFIHDFDGECLVGKAVI